MLFSREFSIYCERYRNKPIAVLRYRDATGETPFLPGRLSVTICPKKLRGPADEATLPWTAGAGDAAFDYVKETRRS